jgi:hypothetical protein
MQAVGEVCRPFTVSLQRHFQGRFGLESQIHRREMARERMQQVFLGLSEVGTQDLLQFKGHCRRNKERLAFGDATADQTLAGAQWSTYRPLCASPCTLRSTPTQAFVFMLIDGLLLEACCPSTPRAGGSNRAGIAAIRSGSAQAQLAASAGRSSGNVSPRVVVHRTVIAVPRTRSASPRQLSASALSRRPTR